MLLVGCPAQVLGRTDTIELSGWTGDVACPLICRCVGRKRIQTFGSVRIGPVDKGPVDKGPVDKGPVDRRLVPQRWPAELSRHWIFVAGPLMISPDLTHWDAILIGAGAAGLLAAARAAQRGRRVLLLEKNRKAGVKILISGGTRCNITQNTDARGIIDAFGKQGRFLHSPLAALSPQDVIRLIEAEGVPTKVEPTGKIFPVSDRALDVRDALLARVARSGCVVRLGCAVDSVRACGEGFAVFAGGEQLSCRKLLITTGGRSYPGCGTVGDGYAWARQFGHTIVPPVPALVPVTVAAGWVAELKGLTLPDVALRVLESVPEKKKPAMHASTRGSLLLAHFGLSGPVALDASRAISRHNAPQALRLVCDFLPELKQPQLEEQLQRRATAEGKKQLVGLLPEEIPRRLAELLLQRANIPEDRRGAELARGERMRLAELLKQLSLPVTGTLGFKKAEVTAGGVALSEVDSRTMASKLVPGVYFAGEILDLDGPIGGYNFQAAFSTGSLAGEHL